MNILELKYSNLGVKKIIQNVKKLKNPLIRTNPENGGSILAFKHGFLS